MQEEETANQNASPPLDVTLKPLNSSTYRNAVFSGNPIK
jgi:hypothetical protein